MYAVREGHIEVIKILLQAGANFQNSKSSAISAALKSTAANNSDDQADVVTILIRAGANINSTNSRHSVTPLMTACSRDSINETIIEALIQAGAYRTAAPTNTTGVSVAVYARCIAVENRFFIGPKQRPH
jgi:ankyrin repeat protein